MEPKNRPPPAESHTYVCEVPNGEVLITLLANADELSTPADAVELLKAQAKALREFADSIDVVLTDKRTVAAAMAEGKRG